MTVPKCLPSMNMEMGLAITFMTCNFGVRTCACLHRGCPHCFPECWYAPSLCVHTRVCTGPAGLTLPASTDYSYTLAVPVLKPAISPRSLGCPFIGQGGMETKLWAECYFSRVPSAEGASQCVSQLMCVHPCVHISVCPDVGAPAAVSSWKPLLLGSFQHPTWLLPLLPLQQ